MNKKELAKLLLKHPLIEKINESQMWDRSIVSRVIAEELMVEQDSNQSIEDMKAAIELLKKSTIEQFREYAGFSDLEVLNYKQTFMSYATPMSEDTGSSGYYLFGLGICL